MHNTITQSPGPHDLLSQGKQSPTVSGRPDAWAHLQHTVPHTVQCGAVYIPQRPWTRSYEDPIHRQPLRKRSSGSRHHGSCRPLRSLPGEHRSACTPLSCCLRFWATTTAMATVKQPASPLAISPSWATGVLHSTTHLPLPTLPATGCTVHRGCRSGRGPCSGLTLATIPPSPRFLLS